MNHFKWIAPASAITLAAVTLLLWKDGSDVNEPVVSNPLVASAVIAQTSGDDTAATPSMVAKQLLEAANDIDVSSSALPGSLRGTEVDGGFRVDENGNLIVELGIKRYFDYFMATVGEESIAEITARIRNAIESQLQEPAKSQALAILQDYLSYKAALYELEQQHGEFNPASFNESQLPLLAGRLEAIFDARRAHLSDEAVDAFFAEDEAVDRYTLERLKVLHNDALSDSERAAQLAQLDEMLPETVRQQRAEATQYERYLLAEAKLQQQNASAAELHQLRAQEFGEEAAVRLAELDQKRAVWDRRLQQYRQEKQQLENAGLSEQDLIQQIERLRSQHFSEIETRRVKALDRIKAS